MRKNHRELVDYISRTTYPDIKGHEEKCQRSRLFNYFAGPQNGEDHNTFAQRMNSVLTNGDRDWLIKFSAWEDHQ